MKVLLKKNLSSIKSDDPLYDSKIFYLEHIHHDSMLDSHNTTVGKRMIVIKIEKSDTVHDVTEMLQVLKYVSNVIVIRFNIEDAKHRVIHHLNNLKESEGYHIIGNFYDNTCVLLAKVEKEK